MLFLQNQIKLRSISLLRQQYLLSCFFVEKKEKTYKKHAPKTKQFPKYDLYHKKSGTWLPFRCDILPLAIFM